MKLKTTTILKPFPSLLLLALSALAQARVSARQANTAPASLNRKPSHIQKSLPGRKPSAAWLRYRPIRNAALLALDRRVPSTIVVAGRELVLQTAAGELQRGLEAMLGRRERIAARIPQSGAIVLATTAELGGLIASPPRRLARLRANGYLVKALTRRRRPVWLIAGRDANGALYGAFALLRRMALGGDAAHIDLLRNPAAPIRWVDQWDNLDGTIERGYGGRSIFFSHGQARRHLARVREYARLLASLGINGCDINNVNADPRVLAPGFSPQLARIAAAMRPWGVRIALSVSLASPQTAGGLRTYDPLDPQVARWWRRLADRLYQWIPDLAGMTVKAGSEGQPGPAAYGRTHAQAANVVARALAPHGGIVLYRAFVYNNHLDYQDLKADRAKAAYDIFAPLDGRFDPNAVVQIKYGPIDFQVREPVSPLIGALRRTNQALELEITQEYTGQQRQLCYLAPMWQKVLRFNFKESRLPPIGRRQRKEEKASSNDCRAARRVRQIVSGAAWRRPLGGMVGVANVGRDSNWMGFDLALANLYAFGRLAWNPRLSARRIAAEWTRLSFGGDPQVDRTVNALLMESWHVYKDYTGVLGLQTLTNILGPHYGPGPESADHNRWGQWIRAGHRAIGMDRTVATGTGFLGQYPPAIAQRYTSLATCPDNLLLFFHHLPYTYRLHSGETVIQHIYNRHYQGAAEAAEFPRWWRGLRGKVGRQRYRAVLNHLEYQAGYARVWRDYIDEYFERLSGIADARGRVGHHPGRIEAEAMRLDGYRRVKLHPSEAASGGEAVVCPRGKKQCRAAFRFAGATGNYRIAVQYFDVSSGTARFRLLAGVRRIAAWKANADLPGLPPAFVLRRLQSQGGISGAAARQRAAFELRLGLTADDSTWKVVRGVRLRHGERIEIVGIPQGYDRASVDFVSIREMKQSKGTGQ